MWGLRAPVREAGTMGQWTALSYCVTGLTRALGAQGLAAFAIVPVLGLGSNPAQAIRQDAGRSISVATLRSNVARKITLGVTERITRLCS